MRIKKFILEVINDYLLILWVALMLLIGAFALNFNFIFER